MGYDPTTSLTCAGEEHTLTVRQGQADIRAGLLERILHIQNLRISDTWSRQRTSPLSLKERINPRTPKKASTLNDIQLQRKELENLVQRRLFLPLYGNGWRSKILVQYSFPSRGILCYPVRFHNLPGCFGVEELISRVSIHLDTPDFVMFTSYREVDGTNSITIGFRWAEDALSAWSRLHGVKYGENLLEAYPIKDFVGEGEIVTISFCTTRTIEERASIVLNTIAVEENVGTEGWETVVTAKSPEHSKLVIKSAKQLLDQLRPKGCNRQATIPDSWGRTWPSRIDWTVPRPRGSIPFSQSFSAIPSPSSLSEFPDADDETNFTEVEAYFPQEALSGMNEEKIDLDSSSRSKDLPDDVKSRAFSQPEAHRSIEARSQLRKFYLKAAQLTYCWKGIHLPSFKSWAGMDLASSETLDDEKKADNWVSFYEKLWNWQDYCLQIMGCRRMVSGEKYDYGPFITAFCESWIGENLDEEELKEVVAAFEIRYSSLNKSPEYVA